MMSNMNQSRAVIQHSDLDESETEEALSLCDLPLRWEDNSTEGDPRRTPRDEDALFEFSSVDLSFDMCAADDIFLRGKLAPSNYGQQQWTRMSFPKFRSESFDAAKGRMMMGLRCNYSAADHRKLRRVSSVATPVVVAEGKSFRQYGFSVRSASGRGAARAKWWYVLAFGLRLKAPVEMEIKDIRNRQKRRGPSTLVPVNVDRESVRGGAAARQDKGQWRLLRALSCKGNEAVAVC